MSMTQVPALLLQGDVGDAVAGAALFGFGLLMFVMCLIFAVIGLIAMWKIYTKAGKPGWACLIPIYNIIVLLEIVGRPVWWILLMFIPLVNIAFALIVYYELAKSFGEGGLIFVLMFVCGIGFLMLAFGNYRYVGPAGGSGQLAPGTTG